MLHRGGARFDKTLNRQFHSLLYRFNFSEAVLFDISVNFTVKSGKLFGVEQIAAFNSHNHLPKYIVH